jgi:hypothetical protein
MTPTSPEIGAGLMDLEPAMVTQADREEAARFFHYADWRDSQENGGTAGPGITARLAETLARHRLAAAPIPLGCDPVVRDQTCVLIRGGKWNHHTVICGQSIVEGYLRQGYAFDWKATDEARAALSQSIPIDGEGIDTGTAPP